MNNIISEEVIAQVTYVDLFHLYGDDFEVYEKQIDDHSHKLYTLSIEFYMGYESLQEAVNIYKKFKEEFHKYLIENQYEKTPKTPIGSFYQTRELSVNFDDYYWVDAGISDQYNIWDLYYYIEDVIKQLETLVMDIELGVIKVTSKN